MSPRVDLLIPELHFGDAVGNHTVLLKELLNENGISVRIVAERQIYPDQPVETLKKWRGLPRLTLLQHGLGSQVAERVIRRQLPIILNYHNITPSRFLAPWEPTVAAASDRGRAQLERLAPITVCAIAVSQFNAIELQAAGFDRICVCPILTKSDAVSQPSRESGKDRARNGGVVLFVGRIAPNKCHQDLIAATALLSRLRSDVELVLVGECASVAYQRALETLAGRLGVGGQIKFTGKVSNSELDGWYRAADVFVCASEHEGLGVPLVEAMRCGLPVIAYDAAAVGETVGEAGLLVKDKRPANLATAINHVMASSELKRILRHRGTIKAKDYEPAQAKKRMWDVLKDYVAAN